MPDNVSDPTNLKTQYAAQVTADLENNAKEQERIGSDVAALQRQLEELEHDHALLLSMQQALAAGPQAAFPAGPAATATSAPKARLPRARGPKDTVQDKGTKRAKGAGRSVEGKQAGAVKERGARRRTSGGDTLREIVSGLLASHDEPRSAAEVTSALAASHPERKVSATVIRNTLEALVAKGQAHRSKQLKSVFYSAVGAASDETAKAAQGAEANAGGSASS